jgi:hypothetical protein
MGERDLTRRTHFPEQPRMRFQERSPITLDNKHF